MSQIERPLTFILIPVCLVLLFYSYLENAKMIQERKEAVAAEKALQEREEARQLLLDSRTLNVEVQHDNDPKTNNITIILSASSSYDNENDEMQYYWKQISGGNVADIRETRKESILNFDAKEGDYGFELTITDNYGASCLDTVLVEVTPQTQSNLLTCQA
jgi:hypothetical protein